MVDRGSGSWSGTGSAAVGAAASSAAPASTSRHAARRAILPRAGGDVRWSGALGIVGLAVRAAGPLVIVTCASRIWQRAEPCSPAPFDHTPATTGSRIADRSPLGCAAWLLIMSCGFSYCFSRQSHWPYPRRHSRSHRTGRLGCPLLRRTDTGRGQSHRDRRAGPRVVPDERGSRDPYCTPPPISTALPP